jgi:hypothetical protein
MNTEIEKERDIRYGRARKKWKGEEHKKRKDAIQKKV